LSDAINDYSQQTYYTRNLINEYMYVDPVTGNIDYPVPLGDILDLNNTMLTSWNARAQINFSHGWRNQKVVLLAGIESRQINQDNQYTREYGFDPGTNTFNTSMNYSSSYSLNPLPYAGTATVLNPGLFSGTLNRYFSYYANGAYTLHDRYTVSLSGRVDESNFFGVKANQRMVPLWSSGLLWDISKESFYHILWLPNLKIRVTYGYNGNTNNNATAFATSQYSTGPILSGVTGLLNMLI
jgi:hypothetical protein